MATRCPACFTINVPRAATEKNSIAEDGEMKCALCGSRYSVAQREAKAA